MEFLTHSARQTKKIGKKLATTLKPGDVVCLYGELGSGKTTFVQGLALGLGIDEPVMSPTFILIRTYHSRLKDIKRIHHIDLYRLDSSREVEMTGIESLLDDNASIFIAEWAEKADIFLPKKRIDIKFFYKNDTTRRILIHDSTGRGIKNQFS